MHVPQVSHAAAVGLVPRIWRCRTARAGASWQQGCSWQPWKLRGSCTSGVSLWEGLL